MGSTGFVADEDGDLDGEVEDWVFLAWAGMTGVSVALVAAGAGVGLKNSRAS